MAEKDPSAHFNDVVPTQSIRDLFLDNDELFVVYFTTLQNELYTDASLRKCIIDGVAGGGKSMLFNFKIAELGNGPGNEPILLFAQKVCFNS